MIIWIDILHIPQFNFYFPVIKKLLESDVIIYLTVLDRGNTVKIVKNDIKKIVAATTKSSTHKIITIDVVGHHRMSKFSAVFEANLLRIFSVGLWRLKHKVDICFTNGFHAAFWSWLFGNPSYTFGDDPETFDYKPKIWFATQVHFCLYDKCYIANKQGNDKYLVVRCLKEWASLNPRIFTSNVNALNKYNLIPKEYVFVREVSVGTVNYAGQGSGAVKNIQHLIPKDKKVLFSLEEKHRRNEYPEDWILLQEPVDDIHSLIYYSAGLVSSGDSMAREAALLGVPAYYLGIRHSMPANLAASKVANLQNEKTMSFGEWVKTLDTTADEAVKKQEELRAKIDSEFIDINEYMMSLVEKHRK